MNNLIQKTVVGFLTLLLALAVAIFGPAGTLNFWQGWFYLLAFFGSTLLITLYLVKYDQTLLESRTEAGPTAETDKRQQVIQSLASLFFIGLFVIPGFDHRYHWSSVPTPIVWIADGFVVLGFLFIFFVFKENSYTSAVIEVADKQKVVSTGPYALVRHPMYLGAGVMLLATSPALGSWMGVPMAILLMLVIAVRAVEEEKFLRANLQGYAQYTQTVRYRLIPFVW